MASADVTAAVASSGSAGVAPRDAATLGVGVVAVADAMCFGIGTPWALARDGLGCTPVYILLAMSLETRSCIASDSAF